MSLVHFIRGKVQEQALRQLSYFYLFSQALQHISKSRCVTTPSVIPSPLPATFHDGIEIKCVTEIYRNGCVGKLDRTITIRAQMLLLFICYPRQKDLVSLSLGSEPVYLLVRRFISKIACNEFVVL